MRLSQLKSDYRSGNISKPDYIHQAHDFHRCLFEYAEFIRGTDIRQIEISDGSVVMTTRTDGIKLVCDGDDKRIAPIEILNFDFYETEELRMTLHLIEDGSTVYDIGGNIGWYAINIAKAKKDSTIMSFEPIPKTFDYLKRNLDINSVPNVVPYNFGFSDKDGSTPFFYYPEGSGNASRENLTGGISVETVSCRVRTLDSFVEEIRKGMDFIKCDVEGAELLVLRGGIGTIRRYQPIIFTELLRKWAGKFGYHPNDVILLLKRSGYRCFVVKGKKLEEFFTMDENTTETNFFFLHSEKHGAIIQSEISI